MRVLENSVATGAFNEQLEPQIMGILLPLEFQKMHV